MTKATEIEYPSSYVVWDLETSGLDPREAKILEIGAMKVIGGKVVEERSWVLDWGIEIPEKITELTGIDNEVIRREGRPAPECLTEFLEFLKKAPGAYMPNVTHNGSRFDIEFLREACQAMPHAIDPIADALIDTAALYKGSQLGMRIRAGEMMTDYAARILGYPVAGLKYNVKVCCETLGINLVGVQQHRALPDVKLTNEIYKKLTTHA